MVDPISDEERRSFIRKLKAGFVVFVGLSAGLISLQTDAGLVGFAAASATGMVLGIVLLWAVLPSRESLKNDSKTQWGDDER